MIMSKGNCCLSCIDEVSLEVVECGPGSAGGTTRDNSTNY